MWGHIILPEVKLADATVPNVGEINTGFVFNTTAPDPVEIVVPVPPFAVGKMPDIPAAFPVVL